MFKVCSAVGSLGTDMPIRVSVGGPGLDFGPSGDRNTTVVGILATLHPLPYPSSTPILSEPESACRPLMRPPLPVCPIRQPAVDMPGPATSAGAARFVAQVSFRIAYRAAYRNHENRRNRLIVAARRLSWTLSALPRRCLLKRPCLRGILTP